MRFNHNWIVLSFAAALCLSAIGLSALGLAQTGAYPQDFSVTQPNAVDPGSEAPNHAMSPDHWGQPGFVAPPIEGESTWGAPASGLPVSTPISTVAVPSPNNSWPQDSFVPTTLETVQLPTGNSDFEPSDEPVTLPKSLEWSSQPVESPEAPTSVAIPPSTEFGSIRIASLPPVPGNNPQSVPTPAKKPSSLLDDSSSNRADSPFSSASFSKSKDHDVEYPVAPGPNGLPGTQIQSSAEGSSNANIFTADPAPVAATSSTPNTITGKLELPQDALFGINDASAPVINSPISVEPISDDRISSPQRNLKDLKQVFPGSQPNTNRPLQSFHRNLKQQSVPTQALPTGQGQLQIPQPQLFEQGPLIPESIGPPVTIPVENGVWNGQAAIQPQATIDSGNFFVPQVAPRGGGTFTAPNSWKPGDPPPSNIIDPADIGRKPNTGFRPGEPTVRHPGSFDMGQRFDHDQKKEEFPPLSEIIATGKYFGTADLAYLKPHFQGNTAIVAQNAGDGRAVPFEFDFGSSPRFRLGFESKIGPGIMLDYSQFDHSSETETIFTDGITTASTSVFTLGPSDVSQLNALNAGESISSRHDFELHQFGVSFFKDLNFRVSRLAGNFGIQYVSINQQLTSVLSDATGAEIGELISNSDMRAFGPQVGFESVSYTHLTLPTKA